jgi:hypothetical protein
VNNLEAFWNGIHLHVQRIFVDVRKQGYARLSAIRTPEILNPVVTGA